MYITTLNILMVPYWSYHQYCLYYLVIPLSNSPVTSMPSISILIGDIFVDEELYFPETELDDIKSFASQYTVGYFYKFESGDEMTIAEAKENWKNWFNSKFRRPTFKARGGET